MDYLRQVNQHNFKNLNSKNIFETIEKLIKDKKLKFIQKQNYKDFKFNHEYISKLIDNIRNQYHNKFSFNIKKNRNLKDNAYNKF